MKKTYFLRNLFSLILLISLCGLNAQQIVTEYSNVSANSPWITQPAINAQDYTTVYSDSNKKVKVNQAQQAIPVMGTDGVNEVTLSIDLDFDPAEFEAPWIVMIYDESGYMDFVFWEGTNPMTLNVPEGTYDLLAEFYNLTIGRTHIIIKEQQVVSGNSTININPSEASNYVSVNALDEDGEVLQPGIEQPGADFPSEVLFDRVIYFKAGNSGLSSASYIWGVPFEGDPVWNFNINDVSERYYLIHTFIGSGYEQGNYFTKFETLNGISDDISLSNNQQNWVYHTEKFQPSLLSGGNVAGGFMTTSTIEQTMAGGWTVYNTLPINPDEAFKGYINTPIDGDPVDFIITPAIVEHFEVIDPSWGEEAFFIRGNPIVSDVNGGVIYGSGDFTFGNFMLPTLSYEYFMNENNQILVLPFHSMFSFDNTTTSYLKPGNNVPITATSFNISPNEYNVLKYKNLGRYGENRESDFFASQFEVNHNGSNLFSGDFMSFIQTSLPTNGEIEIKIINTNTDLEGIEGSNTTTISYNVDSGDAPPTLQHLQFRNADDKVTSIFDSTEGATVRVAAGDFEFVQTDEWGSGYFDYVDGNTVEMHYSVHNENEWSAIELTEYPEHFQMPAFGNYYEGSLSNIGNSNNDVWYDLKILCTDSAGNTQEQVLSPAFKINNTMHIQEVIRENFLVYPNPFTHQLNIVLPEDLNGSYTFSVTDMTGKRVYSNVQNSKSFSWNAASLPKGVYIISIESDGKIIGNKVIKK